MVASEDGIGVAQAGLVLRALRSPFQGSSNVGRHLLAHFDGRGPMAKCRVPPA